MQEMTASELSRRLQENDPPLLLDVREPWEYDTARIEGARLVPMGEVPARLNEFDADREVVVVCHHGMRSARIAMLLEGAGLQRVYNLRGGVDAWAREVDASVPRY